MKLSPQLLVFDLGRVLLHIDVDRCYRTYSDLGIPSHYEISLKTLFQKYESGNISEQHLLDRVNEDLGTTYTYEAFWSCWDAMIVSYDREVVSLIEDLRTNYQVVLLSNTNLRHQLVFEKMYQECFGGGLESLFDRLFYSHELQCSKPSPLIYEKVERALNVEGESILFFDDLKENLSAANERGWATQQVMEDKYAFKATLKRLIDIKKAPYN
ncbi:HAD-IA family hydrolase [Halosquirtibacter laminarini]|uniref:HAD-IA family hydrolase n=1 Tax=Halosquirtibacter laminarini TaxID=3374600 RepID=A0AC61NN95_9BACT|nr:HAD-IA family hydrolase [Prolixibacteraceae bacterium]